MNIFDFREPVNAGTHALWLILSIPATFVLWRRCGKDRSRRLSFLVFGLSLACCYAGSALFHGVRVHDRSGLDVYDRIDHVGIFLLIAGSYTPIAWNMLQPRWRLGVLASAWGMAAVGSMLYLSVGVLPPMVGTTIYLTMGWGAIFCYRELSRFLSHRRLFPLMLGGVLYSVGAIINLMHWPILWPGVFGSHELFHVFVMAGSLAHYLFMLNVVLPGMPVGVEPTPARIKPSAVSPISLVAKVTQPQKSWVSRLQFIWISSSHQAGR
jgi:hemolysin III